MSEPERQMLARYAVNRSSLLEIGVFEGASTKLLADAMSEIAELFAVDPFFKGRLGVCWAKPIARRQAYNSKNRKRIHFVQMLSSEAEQAIKVNFDFIFIDGDHSYEGIKTDWEAWSPRCVIGGVIALHDTRIAAHAPHIKHFGSFKYYNECIRHARCFKEVDCVDTLSLVQRIG